MKMTKWSEKWIRRVIKNQRDLYTVIELAVDIIRATKRLMECCEIVDVHMLDDDMIEVQFTIDNARGKISYAIERFPIRFIANGHVHMRDLEKWIENGAK